MVPPFRSRPCPGAVRAPGAPHGRPLEVASPGGLPRPRRRRPVRIHGFGTSKTARWLNNSCALLPGAVSFGPTVHSDCTPNDSATIQNNVARVVPLEVFGTVGPFGVGYRELLCHQYWNAGADEPPPAGTTYGMQTLIAGTFMQFRIAVNPARSYTFSFCPADGAASATFDSRIEIYGGANCEPMAVTRTICGDDERVLVAAAGQSHLIVRMLDESNLGGTFRLFARRMP